MLNEEITLYLDYYKYTKQLNDAKHRRNGHRFKSAKTHYGDSEIDIPRNRNVCFDSQIIKKRQIDVNSVVNKGWAMVVRGMSQYDITYATKDFYMVLEGISRLKSG